MGVLPKYQTIQIIRMEIVIVKNIKGSVSAFVAHLEAPNSSLVEHTKKHQNNSVLLFWFSWRL